MFNFIIRIIIYFAYITKAVFLSILFFIHNYLRMYQRSTKNKKIYRYNK